MPVLLLARGDQEARDLLKKAIEARYGHRPPLIGSLRIDFDGRTRAKVGPLTTWVPVEVTAQFRFPDAMRWDFIAKPAGVPVRRGTESYDGSNLRSLRGNGSPQIIEEEDIMQAAQRRLWAIAALLLTPLGDHFVELSRVDDLCFEAKNTQLDAAVQVQLDDEHRIAAVKVDALNTDTQQRQTLKLTAEHELATFDDLLLPKKITAHWDDAPWFEVSPSKAANNPEMEDAVFTLDSNPTK